MIYEYADQIYVIISFLTYNTKFMDSELCDALDTDALFAKYLKNATLIKRCDIDIDERMFCKYITFDCIVRSCIRAFRRDIQLPENFDGTCGWIPYYYDCSGTYYINIHKDRKYLYAHQRYVNRTKKITFQEHSDDAIVSIYKKYRKPELPRLREMMNKIYELDYHEVIDLLALLRDIKNKIIIIPDINYLSDANLPALYLSI